MRTTKFWTVPYLPVYNAHFFSIKIATKIAVRSIQDSIVCQARPNLHTLKTTKKVKVRGSVAWGGERAC